MLSFMPELNHVPRVDVLGTGKEDSGRMPGQSLSLLPSTVQGVQPDERFLKILRLRQKIKQAEPFKSPMSRSVKLTARFLHLCSKIIKFNLLDADHPYRCSHSLLNP